MKKAIVITLAYSVGAAAFTLGFEYMGDQHQGLLVFACTTLAIASGRKAGKAATEGGH